MAATLAVITGGREIADDAPHLIKLVQHPLALWRDYRAAGFDDRWGSFPPLFPILFGLLVSPWIATFSSFWAIRLGVLSWTIVAFVLLDRLVEDVEHTDRKSRQAVMWLFAALPSVWPAVALIPQEEIYVAMFGLVAYRLAVTRRWILLTPLFTLIALAAKYFLLILMVPLAFASKKPLRYLAIWMTASFGPLGVNIGYHYLLFGLRPIIAHELSPAASISIWALLWNLGFTPPLQFVRTASVLITAGLVFLFSSLASRRDIPLVFSVAGSLYISLLCLSITFPAYALWAFPFSLICLARIEVHAIRKLLIVLLVLWGVGEWGANLFRGTDLALRASRGVGKSAVAALVTHLLGAAFPYHEAFLTLVLLVSLSGVAIIGLLWYAGQLAKYDATRPTARRPSPVELGS